MKTKAKTVSVEVKVIGPVLATSGTFGVMWKVRLKEARFPFYIDSQLGYLNKEDAEKAAARWEKRSVKLTITS
jgi:FAD/FMN-containing dehydrogenase